MFAKKVWIPILIVLLAVVFLGLLYSQKTHQDAVTIITPVDAKQSTAQQKPPPPGETAESGHWHGDHWHAAPPHETPVAAPEAEADPSPTPVAELTEVQDTATGARHAIPAVQDYLPPLTAQEDTEIERQWREWVDKDYELRVKVSQAHQTWSDLIPETADEVERYQTDKVWQRKAQEAADKYDEVLNMLRQHEANSVLPPTQ